MACPGWFDSIPCSGRGRERFRGVVKGVARFLSGGARECGGRRYGGNGARFVGRDVHGRHGYGAGGAG